jgi:hypothetical protein
MSRSKVILTRGDSVDPEPIRWLWKDWLARGKYELLAGEKGAGKTTLMVDLAARLTSGGKWPDGSTVSDPGDVLFWSSEDDYQDTILPRFMAAGGDRGRLYHVAGMERSNGEMVGFDPRSDMRSLQDAAAAIPNLRMIVVDPVVSMERGDGNTNATTRHSLQPLVDFANNLGCVAVGITHFNKDSREKTILQRINGSLAYTAVARVVFAAAKMPNGAPNRFVRVIGNIAPQGGGFEYLLEQGVKVSGFPHVETQRCVWGAALTGDPEELLSPASTQKSRDIDRAKDWLRDQLRSGPVPTTELRAAVDGMGMDFSWATVRRAKDDLKMIVAEQVNKAWYWRMMTPQELARMTL